MAWKMTVNIKPFIGEDASEEGAKRAGMAIHQLLTRRLRGLPLYRDDQELSDILDGLEGVENSDEFNYILADLYDWADENRIWLGLL